MGCTVPSCTFKIHTIDEASILRLFGDFLWSDFIIDLGLKVQFINGNDMLSSVVLQNTCEEGLWEEESTDPEHSWSTSFDPFLQESYSVIQVLNP